MKILSVCGSNIFPIAIPRLRNSFAVAVGARSSALALRVISRLAFSDCSRLGPILDIFNNSLGFAVEATATALLVTEIIEGSKFVSDIIISYLN